MEVSEQPYIHDFLRYLQDKRALRLCCSHLLTVMAMLPSVAQRFGRSIGSRMKLADRLECSTRTELCSSSARLRDGYSVFLALVVFEIHLKKLYPLSSLVLLPSVVVMLVVGTAGSRNYLIVEIFALKGFRAVVYLRRMISIWRMVVHA